MKNIITITLAILVLLLAGFLLSNFIPKGDSLADYLPASITVSDQHSYTQASIDARMEPYVVPLGASDEDSIDFEVVSMQGDYFDSEGRMAVTVIAQKLKKDTMAMYQEKAWERFTEPTRGGKYEKQYVNGYDVYLSFRELDEETDTSGMFILGSGYIFIPDENVVLAFSMFNTRLYACEQYTDPSTCLHDQEKILPTIENAKELAEKITEIINSK